MLCKGVVKVSRHGIPIATVKAISHSHDVRSWMT